MSTPEGKIQLAILKHLRKKGILCWRNNTGGTWDPKLQIYRSNPYIMPGAPDIICIIDGFFVGIEVKTPKGKQSADQILFEKRCKRHGGKYTVATCVADVDNFLLQ